MPLCFPKYQTAFTTQEELLHLLSSQRCSPFLDGTLSIATLESIYTKYGYQVLNRILRLIISTWEGDINSFSANIFNALTKLVVTFGDSLNDEIFKEKVGNVSVKQLVRMAKERRSGSMGVAEAMLIEYNGKRKNPAGRLPINKLYAKDAAFFPELTETYGEEEFSYENTTVPEDD